MKDRPIDLTGMIGRRIHSLTVIDCAGSAPGGTLWRCRCDCGAVVVKRTTRLTSGYSKSCSDCLEIRRAEAISTHGATRAGRPQLYGIWLKMRDRCTNPKTASYRHYGAKGISRCAEWDDYATFSAWCMSNGYARGMSIDRIDSSLGYCPENCRIIPTRDNRVAGLAKATQNRRAAKAARMAIV